MALLDRLSIAKKINLSFYISFIVTIILIVQPFVLIRDIESAYNKQIAAYTNSQKMLHVINDSLRKIDNTGIENALLKKEKSFIKNIDLNYDAILSNLALLKENALIVNNAAITRLLNNVKNRIIGYRQIAKSIKEETKEDYEDGMYAILALSQARSKISKELNALLDLIAIEHQKHTQEMQVQIAHTLKIKIAITIFMLFLLFLLNKKISESILKKLGNLHNIIDAFFDFLNKKRKDALHVDMDSDDEIGQMASLIDQNISVAERFIKSERNHAREIEIQVNEATKEIKKLNKELHSTQKEIIHTMGAIAEKHSKETGMHIMRVANYSFVLAKLAGLSTKEAILLRDVSPMHDIGKLGIADAILNKPAKFTDEEFEKMKEHTTIGYNMLKNSNRTLLKSAAIVAHEHHERWDGKGYPRGIKGEKIHIYGRITAIVDVFDALASNRVYKTAWPLDKILKLFEEESGKQFDPRLTKLFITHIDRFLESKKALEARVLHKQINLNS